MIRVEGVRKSFGARVVLEDLSLAVAGGDVYGLLGPNGAGKTTLINILCGLQDADAGRVELDGRAARNVPPRLVGVVPQEISLYRDLTCAENLGFFGRIYGLSRSGRQERVEALIETFRLGEYRDTEVSKLSGGWQRRVNIAVALVHSPALLILDEPTAGLDVESRFELWELIAGLKHTGVTVLMTTHQLEEAERLCSRIGIVHEGRIVAAGSLAELRRRVPAQQLAVVQAPDEAPVCERAQSLGWSHRRYAGRLTLLLPERLGLREVVDRFDAVPLSAVSLQSVGLEQVYLEVTTRQPLPRDACLQA